MNGVKSLGNLLSNEQNRYPKNFVLIEKVRNHWVEAVGERIARKSYPKFIKSRVLFVLVDDPIWIQELSLVKEDILEKLQKIIQDRKISVLIESIRFINGVVPPKQNATQSNENLVILKPEIQKLIDKETENIQDEELKALLKSYLRINAINMGEINQKNLIKA